MDLTQRPADDDVTLGLLSHVSGTAERVDCKRSPKNSDGSVSHPNGSRVRNCFGSTAVDHTATNGLVKRDENNSDESKDIEDGDGEDEVHVEEFRILGHSMTLKRKRECDSVLASTTPPRLFSNEIEARRAAVRTWGNQSLRDADPDIFGIMEKEKHRQFKGIELIALENFVCRVVLEALGSHLTNKYSEGMPGARYYGGNEHIDDIEKLCCERAFVGCV